VPEDSDDGDLIVVYGDKDEAQEDDEGKSAVPETTKAPEDAAKPDTTDEPAEKPEAEARKPATSLGPERAPKEEEPAPTPDSEPEYRRVTEYWIQVISSPSRDRVEQAKERLEAQELGGRITSKFINGETYYRLRVGPYGNKAEAAKFLQWISEIEGFGESYISEEYPLKRVN
jgi:cell division protein FtsN